MACYAVVVAPHPDQTARSLDEVAETLGVHYQTAYRWVRAGRLPAVKVDGRYQVDQADLEAFQESRSAPAAPPRPSSDRLGRQRRAMSAALFDGDETAALAIVTKLSSNGTSVTQLIEEVLAPPLVEIGDAWRRGDATIFVEHRATAIVERILGAIAPNPRGRRRGVALVVGAADDRHSLPTHMATAALREDNWTVQHLGSDVPVEELLSFVDANQIDLVAISAIGPGALGRADEARAAIGERHGIPVLVGEPGMTVGQLRDLARGAAGPQR